MFSQELMPPACSCWRRITRRPQFGDQSQDFGGRAPRHGDLGHSQSNLVVGRG
jgi:hypothetical protein